MKRLPRDPEKFETVEFFSALSPTYGYQLNSQESIDNCTAKFKESLIKSSKEPTILHGKRIESLFSHVAGAMGETILITNEDRGEIISKNENIAAPDYRITLKNGDQILVEVKNHNSKKINDEYPLDIAYVNKLEDYAKINNTPLYFAIYLRVLRKWTLLNKNDFLESGNKLKISIINAMKRNRMAIIGDKIIATRPIIVEIIQDPNKKKPIINNKSEFTIGDIKFYCDKREITDDREKNIAFYLIRFGCWDCNRPEVNIESGRFIKSIKYEFKPESMGDLESSELEIIGWLSEMVTKCFNEETVYKNNIIALDSKFDPHVFSLNLQDDHKCDALPLGIFYLEPDIEGN
ncbi:hypothetical protein NGC36_24155 [Serratia rubidaea]|uniref:hypothetical protein n=1 Tax=Serratia rubidaea TaxID=61652 RepID=UPI002DBA212B|nr:hypothetical protein [Serratia rubidaea]MEB7588359.1 hypothetical protein [Serratia rubidaea]